MAEGARSTEGGSGRVRVPVCEPPLSSGASISSFAKEFGNLLSYLSHTNMVYTAIAAAVWALLVPQQIAAARDIHGGPTCRGGDSLGCASKHAWGWMAMVAVRHVVLGVVVYGLWHWACYLRQPPVAKKKLNPQVRAFSSTVRDACWTVCGCCIASSFEIAAIHLWSLGYSEHYTRLADYPLRSAAMFTFSFFWADFHFYWAHRVLHPWRVIFCGVDPGKVLYKYVHSLHHKANNPTPWSGLAMHPVEHLVYFSRSLWPLFVNAHPLVFLASNTRAMLGPAPGHSGFEDFYGSRFHLLHHAFLECNYGTRGTLDRIFGTYRDVYGKDGQKKAA